MALEPPLDDFLHHAQIVHGFTLHRVGAVLFLRRPSISQHDARSDAFLTLQLGHVETNHVIEAVQSEEHRTLVRRPLFQAA